MMGASQTSPSSVVWSVEVSAEGVYRDTVLKLALRLSLAEDEREKPPTVYRGRDCCVEFKAVRRSFLFLGQR